MPTGGQVSSGKEVLWFLVATGLEGIFKQRRALLIGDSQRITVSKEALHSRITKKKKKKIPFPFSTIASLVFT